MALGVTAPGPGAGGGEWALSSYAVPFSRALSPQPSSLSPSQAETSVWPLLFPLGTFWKAEVGHKENMNIQADETLSAAQ